MNSCDLGITSSCDHVTGSSTDLEIRSSGLEGGLGIDCSADLLRDCGWSDYLRQVA